MSAGCQKKKIQENAELSNQIVEFSWVSSNRYLLWGT